MLLSTANIMGNPLMRQQKVVADVKTVKSRSSIVGWQEIKTDRYKRAVREVYSDHWDQCELQLPIPISVRTSQFRILKSGHKLTHYGKAGASPNRYVSWAYVKSTDLPFKFLVMNTHYVSGAWNNKLKYAKAWRQRVWEVHWKVQRELVLDAHRAGFSILGTGDFNRIAVQKFHPDQQWLTNHTIDKLWWLEGPNGPKFHEISPVIKTDLYSDHHLRTSRIRLR